MIDWNMVYAMKLACSVGLGGVLGVAGGVGVIALVSGVIDWCRRKIR